MDLQAISFNRKKGTITLTNRESLEHGHHGAPYAGSVVAGLRNKRLKEAAQKIAKKLNRHVEVFATRRNCQPWVVYACDHEGNTF